MRRNQWLAAPLGAATAAALLSGCGSTDNPTAGGSKGVVMGISDKVKSTDPASGYDPGSWLLFNNVFQSLLSFPKGGTTPEPDAAQACNFEGADSKVYKCTLREGLKFSNGNALTSKDVKFSFERTLKINDANGPAVMLSSIAGIDTPTTSPSSSASRRPTRPSPARSHRARAPSSTTASTRPTSSAPTARPSAPASTSWTRSTRRAPASPSTTPTAARPRRRTPASPSSSSTRTRPPSRRSSKAARSTSPSAGSPPRTSPACPPPRPATTRSRSSRAPAPKSSTSSST